MRDAINKAARFIINRCLNDGVGNLVFGWNEGQKVGSDLGFRNNQNFVPIPTGRLITRLKQLCEEYGIVFTITEEAYTSQASFLDGDSLPSFTKRPSALFIKMNVGRLGKRQYGEKPDGWSSSGKRVKRGLYKTAKSKVINADCNGAANIRQKSSQTARHKPSRGG